MNLIQIPLLMHLEVNLALSDSHYHNIQCLATGSTHKLPHIALNTSWYLASIEVCLSEDGMQV